MSLKTFPFGVTEVAIPANGRLALYSKSPVKIYQRRATPNQPATWTLMTTVIEDAIYQSAAFAAATMLRIEAGAAMVLYAIGTDAVVIEQRGFRTQPDPIALNATGDITAAMIGTGIITSSTAAAVTGTLPTGTVLDAAIGMKTGETLDWFVINTGGANAFTVAAAAGHTIVGAAAVAASTSARFITRRTAAATYVTYRV